jgi:cobalamin synthase
LNPLTRRILQAAIIGTVLALTGVIVEMQNHGLFEREAMLLLVAAFIALTSLSLYIFFMGRSKPDGEDSLFTMSAIGIKFLLSIIVALVWFAVLKKVETGELLIFFVLYLTFTVFLVGVIVKELKNNSFKK